MLSSLEKILVCMSVPVLCIVYTLYGSVIEYSRLQVNFIKSQQSSKGESAKNQLLYFLRSVYNKYILQNLEYSDQERIPKVIHQIWLGSPVPEHYKAWQATWLLLHPRWTYVCWDEEKLRNFPLKNRDIFERAHSYGVKSDIARYEILYQLGGLYVDFDMECLRSFAIFHHCCDFYACLEPNAQRIGNAIIGSRPGNEVLAACLEQISRSNTQVTTLWDVVNTTGPGLLTRCFVNVMNSYEHRYVVFPAGFFYPEFFDDGSKMLRPETHAIHYWHGAWMR